MHVHLGVLNEGKQGRGALRPEMKSSGLIHVLIFKVLPCSQVVVNICWSVAQGLKDETS